MKYVIHKHPLEIRDGAQSLEFLGPCCLMTVDFQGRDLVLWERHPVPDSKTPGNLTVTEFLVVATGQEFTHGRWNFFGTASMLSASHPFVVHVFWRSR